MSGRQDGVTWLTEELGGRGSLGSFVESLKSSSYDDLLVNHLLIISIRLLHLYYD